MDDLIAFVTARLDEDEAAITDDEVDDGMRFADVDPQSARFIWRFADEDRVKREVTAKRAILAAYERAPLSADLEESVIELAAVWSDHPEWSTRWHLSRSAASSAAPTSTPPSCP